MEEHLTSKEKEILSLLVRGKTNKEISHVLIISEHTVKNHIYSIFQKLKIKNRKELIYIHASKNYDRIFYF